MTPPAGSAAACTCAACPLLCDDIVLGAAGAENACAHGREAFLAALAAGDEGPEARVDDVPAGRQAALDRAAELLHGARRPLVTGLAAATLEEIAAACDLAEQLGAAVDAGLPDSSRATGPTIALAGEVTAAWEELRDRADLVVFWFADPAASHPRFLERFVPPRTADGTARRTIAVGAAGAMPAAADHLHLPLPHSLAVEAARGLHILLLPDRRPSAATSAATPADGPLERACTALHEAVRAAGCVAFVTAAGSDSVGLEPWSMAHLIRTIAHTKPAFEIPLGAGIAAGGADACGAAAVCTWRYGAAGAIALADRSGGPFLPGEADAARLIARGEVDAVVAVGRLSGRLEEALAGAAADLAVVRISDRATAGADDGRRSVGVRSSNRLLATAGTMLREDGRRVALVPLRTTALPGMRDLLVDLGNAIRARMPCRKDGGAP